MLTSKQRSAVNEDERVTEFSDRFQGQTATPREQTTQAFATYDSGILNAQGEVLKVINGAQGGVARRKAISVAKTAIFKVQEAAFGAPEVDKYLNTGKEKPALVDQLRLLYRFIEASPDDTELGGGGFPEDQFGSPDFAAAEREREEILLRADAAGISRKLITETKKKFDDPVVEHLFQTIELINKELLTDFYSIEQEVIGTSPESRSIWQEYRNLDANERTAFKDEHEEVKDWEADIRNGRASLRESNRLIDAVRVVYWGSSPAQEDNVDKFADEGPESVDKWLKMEISKRMSNG